MGKEEFILRCYQEYYAKDPEANKKAKKAETIEHAVMLSGIIIGIIVGIFISGGNDQVYMKILIVILSMGVSAGISGILSEYVKDRLDNSIYEYPRSIIRKAIEDESYLNYPSNYPYSILYPGEPCPFELEDAEPDELEADENDELAPVEAQPEQVTITCAQCGQPMLIPVSNGAVKITCPKCGNSFIHTN